MASEDEGAGKTRPTTRAIPDYARELRLEEFERWCEIAGAIEFDRGAAGETADREAYFRVLDERSREKKGL